MRARVMVLGIAVVAGTACARFQTFPGAAPTLFSKTVTVSGALVSGTDALTDFPLLISVTDPELKDLAHGGAVGAGGFSLGTQQSLDVERYDGATGTLVAWVRVPTITSAAGASFELDYGESLPSTVPSEGVWSDFAGVWHMAGDPTLGVADSTLAHDSGTCAGGMSATNVVPCKIGDCLSFDGVDDTIQVTENGDNLNFSSQSFSLSMWVHADVNLGLYDMPWHKGGSNINAGGYDMELGQAFWDTCLSDGTQDACADFGTESLVGSWHYLVENVDRANGALEAWTDGVRTGNVDISLFGSTATTSPALIDRIGDPLKGSIDELRVQTSARSGPRILAEYRNQSSPTQYVTLGPATPR